MDPALGLCAGVNFFALQAVLVPCEITAFNIVLQFLRAVGRKMEEGVERLDTTRVRPQDVGNELNDIETVPRYDESKLR